MKNIKLSVIVILAITILSCESKGPRGQVYVPDVSIDEVVEDVFDGSEIIGTPYGYGSNAFGIAKYTKNRFLCVSSNAFKGVKSTL